MGNTNPLLQNNKLTEIQTNTLTAKKNILRFGTVSVVSVQISNISSVEREVYFTEKPSILLKFGIGCVVVASFFFLLLLGEGVFAWEFILAAIGAGCIYVYSQLKETVRHYLAIYTNCGRHYRLFIGEDQDINWQVLDVLEYLIENGGHNEAINIRMNDAYITDMHGATISGSQFLNKMNNSKIEQ